MKNFARKCVKDLEAYKVEAPQYDIILNANENPWDFPEALKKDHESTAEPLSGGLFSRASG